MNLAEILREIRTLSVDERIWLAGEIWDSIGEAEFVIPEEHLIELERRIADYEANPSAGIPWEEVRERISRRFGPEREDASGG